MFTTIKGVPFKRDLFYFMTFNLFRKMENRDKKYPKSGIGHVNGYGYICFGFS